MSGMRKSGGSGVNPHCERMNSKPRLTAAPDKNMAGQRDMTATESTAASLADLDERPLSPRQRHAAVLIACREFIDGHDLRVMGAAHREAQWGEAQWGDAQWGEAQWGEAQWGDARWGEAQWGEGQRAGRRRQTSGRRLDHCALASDLRGGAAGQMLDAVKQWRAKSGDADGRLIAGTVRRMPRRGVTISTALRGQQRVPRERRDEVNGGLLP